MDIITTSESLKNVQSALPQSAPSAGQQLMLFGTNGAPANKCYPNQLITDGASLGGGIATCTTAGTTQAKTVALSNYILLKNIPVAVRFQNGINVAGATLNINSQGAKPIYIGGVALPAGVIKENTTVTLVYDGTNYNITAATQGVSASDALLVDMGLPSGLMWATRNIDVTQPNGFAASPFQYECSFCSWGNTEMHNPISAGGFQYDFGSSNEGPYASTPGAALTGNAGLGYDAARANLGGPWRMPTTEEYAELFSNIKYIDANGDEVSSSSADKRVTVNGIVGLYLESNINGRRLFFACSGYGTGTSWYDRGSSGYYWSSSLYSSAYGRDLLFYSGGVNPQYYSNRFRGFSVRAVQ